MDTAITSREPPANLTIKQFRASDGYEFHYRHWTTEHEQPLGYVVALHGIQSHSGWYEYSSSRLAKAGFDVSFLDRRGSGLNRQARGHTPSHERLINDVVQFLQHIRHRRNHVAPTSPVILLGVSWGAKLAAVTTATRGELVDGLAILYPGICSRIRARCHQRFLLQLAIRLGIRERLVRIPLDDPGLFTLDPNWQQFIREDPLAIHEVTTSLLSAGISLDWLAMTAPPRIRCPALMMLAGEDRIIDNEASWRYFERFGSPRRQLIEYPDAAHTLEFEPDRDLFVDDLIEWLTSVGFSGKGKPT